MGIALNLTGRQFGLLTVLERSGSYRGAVRLGRSQTTWLCLCACGRARVFTRKQLLERGKRYCAQRFHVEESRAIRSAATRDVWLARGCEPVAATRYPLTASSWRSMLERCKPGGSYERFGITVCERWQGSFEAFLSDMGERPSRLHTIDRRDTFGNYEPGNCRWARAKVQGRNRRNVRWIEWKGKQRKLITVCRAMGLDLTRVGSRLNSGWSVERALTEPVIPRGHYAKSIPLDRPA